MRVLTVLFLLVFSTLTLAQPLNKMVVFGDSLSDNGNLYEFMEHRIPISPPYYEGRFTNGPVWVERLISSYFPEDNVSRLLNYAFGGAGISDLGDDDALFTLKHEVDVYLLAHKDEADPESLFIVWIGANNYLAVPDDVEAAVKQVNVGISHELERLVNKGARNILVLNTPDLGRTPVAHEFEAEEQLTLLTKRHNEELAIYLSKLEKKYPEVKWLLFDAEHSANDVLDSPADYGFTNIHDTCYDIEVDKYSQRSIVKMAGSIKKKASKDQCEGYLFFDPVHFTAPAHQIIADRIRNVLDAAGIEFK